jgi:choline dehydrogenase-like flavoprotein
MPNNFDVIVIGSGMSGGWAAKDFCDKGLKTLVLERGKEVTHIKDYPTTNKLPWQFEHRNELTADIIKENPVASSCYAFREDAMHFFVKDKEHPYVQEKPFSWIRGYQTGGKSLMWARQTQRWSDLDFDGPARDGYAVDWPIRYKDLASWYSYVEKFVGISGNKDGLAALPDGDFLPPMEQVAIEQHFSESISKNYKDRNVIIGRCAHLTEPQPIHIQQGRGQCQNRNLCQRGCPFGGYFSSNSATLPWAQKTGNLTLQNNAVVHSIIYDEKLGKATGVRVIDAITKKATEYFARIIFVNAAAVNTNIILLNSTSNRFPNGLGNDNGLMGKFFAFHNYKAYVSGEYEGLLEYTTKGRRPNGSYMPRFRNLLQQDKGLDFLRGYATGIYGNRDLNLDKVTGIGEKLKQTIDASRPDYWSMSAHLMGETLPKKENYVKLDANKKDDWGIPLANISVGYDDNDHKMTKDFMAQATEMFEKAGFKNITPHDSDRPPGLDIHEMGGVRMGNDPATSLLNKWNQLHHCKNVFVTDGACMTSTSTQNPSLTYMALTARAADYAMAEMKKQNL